MKSFAWDQIVRLLVPILLLAIVFAPLVLASCGGEPTGAANGNTDQPSIVFANPDPSLCIVSDDVLDTVIIAVEYDGKVYAVCCDDCEAAFRADPERYIAGGRTHDK